MEKLMAAFKVVGVDTGKEPFEIIKWIFATMRKEQLWL